MPVAETVAFSDVPTRVGTSKPADETTTRRTAQGKERPVTGVADCGRSVDALSEALSAAAQGQKDPVVHGAGVTLPEGQYEPGVHAMQVAEVLSPVDGLKVPPGHGVGDELAHRFVYREPDVLELVDRQVGAR